MPASIDVKSFRQIQILFLLVVIGFVAYSSVLNSYFLSDDFAQIGKILGGDFSVTWGRAHGGFFRPLFILSYLIETKIWGTRPLGFHLTNVALHALSAFLLFALSLRLLQELDLPARTKTLISLGAALLFLLHPSHTEAVSWISGRADLIATCFCLGSLLWFVAYANSKRGLHLVLSLLSFALSLFAKESAICLPFLVLVIGLGLGKPRSDGRARKQFLGVLALFFVILVAFILIRSVFIGALVGGYGTSQHLNFSAPWLRDRLLEASVRSVLPALPSRWSNFLFKPLQSPLFILIVVICAGLIATAIFLRRKLYDRPERKEQNIFLLALLLLFLFSLLPVINLRLSLYQTLGERFLYLPSVFSCLLMSYLSAILVRKIALWLLILMCVIGFYAATLYQTNRLWREAAALSRSIKDDLVNSSSRDRLLILNAPDNLRGVPVYHNGFPEAIQYFQNQKHIEQIQVVSFHSLQSPKDEVESVRSFDFLRLNLVNKDDGFIEFRDADCLELLGHTNNSMDLRRGNCSSNTDLFYFTKGRMIKISDTP